MRRLRDVAVDVTPLRESRDFRLLYAGTALSQFGSQFTAVAVPFVIYQETGSTLAVGLFGGLAFLPLIVLNILGGAIADKFEQRRTIVLGQLVGGVAAMGAAFNVSLDRPNLVLVYVLGIVDIGAFAVTTPAQRGAIPRLVPRDLLASAAALKAVSGSIAHVAGPALGGLCVVTLGPTTTFVLDAGTFLGSAVLLSFLRRLPPVHDHEVATFGLVLDGFRHLRRQPILLGAFASDLNAMIFGMPTALFPAVAATRFPENPEALGLLYAAPFVGSLVASAASGWTRNVTAHGQVVTFAVMGWGAAMAVFGVVDGLVLSLVALAAAGFSDMISGISRQAILQLASPPDLIGRMEGVGMAVWTGGPRLGDLEAGVVASLTSINVAIATGGLLCIGGMALLAKVLPGFASFRSGAVPAALTTDQRDAAGRS